MPAMARVRHWETVMVTEVDFSHRIGWTGCCRKLVVKELALGDEEMVIEIREMLLCGSRS